jgi:hypothetical protein
MSRGDAHDASYTVASFHMGGAETASGGIAAKHDDGEPRQLQLPLVTHGRWMTGAAGEKSDPIWD